MVNKPLILTPHHRLARDGNCGLALLGTFNNVSWHASEGGGRVQHENGLRPQGIPHYFSIIARQGVIHSRLPPHASEEARTYKRPCAYSWTG